MNRNPSSSANATVSCAFTWDRLNRLTGKTGGTTTYTMDALYRLSTADYPASANDELLTYDKVGNRKTTTKGSLTANAGTMRILTIVIKDSGDRDRPVGALRAGG